MLILRVSNGYIAVTRKKIRIFSNADHLRDFLRCHYNVPGATCWNKTVTLMAESYHFVCQHCGFTVDGMDPSVKSDKRDGKGRLIHTHKVPQPKQKAAP